MFNVLTTTALIAFGLSGADALQCNGCRGCGRKRSLPGAATGISVRWVYDHSGKIDSEKQSQPIIDGVAGGERLRKPDGAVGMHISSSRDAAIAGWYGDDDNEPMHYYVEHINGDERIYYLPERVREIWAGLL